MDIESRDEGTETVDKLIRLGQDVEKLDAAITAAHHDSRYLSLVICWGNYVIEDIQLIEDKDRVQEWINDLTRESLVLLNQPLPDLTNDELDRISKIEANLEKIELMSRRC